MALDAPFGQHNFIGKHAGEAAALTWIQSQNWDSNKNGTGTPENGMTFYDTSANAYKAYVNGSWVDAGGTGFHDHDHSASGVEGGQLNHATAFSAYGSDDHTEYILAAGTRDFSDVVKGVTPTDDAHLATKGYVDALAQGLEWQDSVKDKDLVTAPSPTIGDRYIVAGTGGDWSGGAVNDIAICIAEGDDPADWEFTTPNEGFACWVDDEDTSYVFTSSWVKMASIYNHNDTANKQGGTTDEYYHLTAAEHTDLTDGNDCSEHKHDQLYYTETEIDALFHTTTGHDHDGSNSKKVTYSDLASIPSTFAPSAHKASHQNGGSDEISVAGLSGVLADDQNAVPEDGIDTSAIHDDTSGEIHAVDDVAPATADEILIEDATDTYAKKRCQLGDIAALGDPKGHHTSHENGGSDEISVAGLSGELADNQPAKAHLLGSSTHTADTLANLNSKISDGNLSKFSSGANTPEGSVTGNVGDKYLDTTNFITYMKMSGTGNTGWYVA